MDSVDAALYRGNAAHPSSPIDFNVDTIHPRPHPSNGSSSLGVAATRQTASPRPAPPPPPPQPLLKEVLPEEEELDQFDIVLQQDAAASNSQFAGTHSPSGATPPLASCAASSGPHGAAGGSNNVSNSLSSPSVLLQSASKLMPSVAGVCQASALTQDREQCARLIHQMTSILRGEINLHGQPTNSSANGSTTTITTATATTTRSTAASVVASPGGDPRATSSPASLAAAVAASASAHNFEEELSLLTDIILEANLAHNPQWTANVHRGTGSTNGYPSPLHAARSSPRSGGVGQSLTGIQAVAAGAAAAGVGAPHSFNPTNSTAGATVAVAARSHSRTSPAGPGAYVSMRQISPTAAGSNAQNTDGRSTIDTEVSDSLCRLSNMGGGGGAYHHLYVMEHDVRPMNPCQGAAAGPTATTTAGGGNSSGSASRQTNSTAPFPQPPPSAAAPWASLMYGSANVGHLDRAAIASLTNQQSSRRANGSAARSTSATVKHPRAVKPDPRNDLAKVGRIRGPRSRTGKNVAPSSHSAFSECSGGETRSCRSTLTGAHRVLSSSANVTTNTSMSSSVFNHIQVEHVMAATSGDRRD
ncbi:hypothetical protein ABB37_07954 [Leptomonas pyrrhocoris]|uniref:Uncharacterized protein n=1 Tax=Leptomonas pyrrhocoris TaxID=157538 RepID=A0A0M9FU87_LEPPY|nr:hypothetical protein ABB37_07954 [Leptomonas pyrrhocoris]KPA76200.1 hypothetical protein ABB37_07954 [Leptomonas pyrrhocoris]|eukprot:XP_015654639.1 hypothetical protein ABB37_07954 [Leptomonas pyrrhocoris]